MGWTRNIDINKSTNVNCNSSKFSCGRPGMIPQLKTIADSATKMYSKQGWLLKARYAKSVNSEYGWQNYIAYSVHVKFNIWWPICYMPNAHGNNIHMCVQCSHLLPFLLWFLLRVLLCDSDGATAIFMNGFYMATGLRHSTTSPVLMHVCPVPIELAMSMKNGLELHLVVAERGKKFDENWMACQQSAYDAHLLWLLRH